MSTDAAMPQGRSRAVLSRPLKRGTACMNCRFLKIKCDGVRPLCGPCRKHPKDDECEYTDGPARSRTKALEDTVQRLEARLLELERPEENTPSVTLYDPYTAAAQPNLPYSQSLPSTPYGMQLPRLHTPGSSESHLNMYSPPPSTTASTPPFGPHGHALSPLGIFDSRSVVTPDSSVSSGLDFHDTHLGERLIQTFLPHATQFGFFLDPQFAMMSPPSPAGGATSFQRSSPMLFAILCAFGAHMSTPRDRINEDRFAFRALQSSANAIDYTQTLLHTIQAEVLIAYYLWRNGAILQARVHSASAAALVMGAGLHQNRATVINLVDNPNNIDEQSLPLATDSIAVGERIRAVWAVSALQKQLAMAHDLPIDVCGVFEQASVEVPWPREVEEYRDRHHAASTGENTTKLYLGGQEQDANDSLAGMLMKALVLLHRSVYMQGQWATATTQGQQQTLMTAFHSLVGLVDALRGQLPSRYPDNRRQSPAGSNRSHSSGSSTYSQPVVGPSTPTYSPSPKYGGIPSTVDERVCFAHALLDGATLRLHDLEGQMAPYMHSYSYGYDASSARAASVRSAKDMLNSASGLSSGNPFTGTLLGWAISVLADELKLLRQQNQAQQQAAAGWSPQRYDFDYEQELRAALQEGMSALQAGARECVAMRRDFLRARETIAFVDFANANEMAPALGIGVGAGV